MACSLKFVAVRGKQDLCPVDDSHHIALCDVNRISVQSILRLSLVSILTIVAAGCATQSSEGIVNAGAEISAQSNQLVKREATLNTAWRGRPYDAVLQAFGEPKMMMNVLGFRPQKTSLLVYGIVDAKANCVDAFTMVKNDKNGEWSVAEYFCR